MQTLPFDATFINIYCLKYCLNKFSTRTWYFACLEYDKYKQYHRIDTLWYGQYRKLIAMYCDTIIIKTDASAKYYQRFINIQVINYQTATKPAPYFLSKVTLLWKIRILHVTFAWPWNNFEHLQTCAITWLS